MRRKACFEILFSVFVGGIGVLTDFYDLSVINLVKRIINFEYPIKNFDTSWENSILTSSSLIGALIGQLLLGHLADRLGRRNLFLTSGILACIGSFGCACAFNFNENGIYWILTLSRLILGIGVGGEYPLSASYSSENSDHKSSGFKLALTYSMMGIGTFLSSLVVYLCQLLNLPNEFTWRFAFAVGGFLSLFSLFVRWKFAFDTKKFIDSKNKTIIENHNCMANRQRLSIFYIDSDDDDDDDDDDDNNNDAKTENCNLLADNTPLLYDKSDHNNKLNVKTTQNSSTRMNALKCFFYPAIGTAVSWFLYDIVDYGFSLYSDQIVNTIMGSASSDDQRNGDANKTFNVLIVNLIGLVGYVFSAWFVPYVGRKQSQIIGAAGMAACYLWIILGYNYLENQPGVFLFIFMTQLFFNNIGPGCTTYIIPGEIFPISLKATMHGISSASGKLGAVVGTLLFPCIQSSWGMVGVFYFVFGCAICLVLWTMFFTPNYNETQIKELEMATENNTVIELLYNSKQWFRKNPTIRESDKVANPPGVTM